MDEKEYIEERLQSQIDWYNAKSSYNQYWYKRFRTCEIASAAMIPFLTGLTDLGPSIIWIIGLLGVLIAISTAIVSLYKFQENWIQYRNTAESLMQEKILYLTRSNQYQSANNFQLLVERVEGLISNQNTSWLQYVGEEETINHTEQTA